MTICIAAVCEASIEPKIILCTDWRVGGSLGIADTSYKQRFLTPRGDWICLTSGYQSDINALLEIYRRDFGAGQEITTANVDQLVKRPLSERKRQKADEYTGGKYGILYDDFLKIGKDKLPAELFRDAMIDISKISLRAEFIVTGFADGLPMLYETTPACVAVLKDEFAVVGEGAYLAESVLLRREQSDIRSLSKTLYCVWEAKKYAERVSSVGEYTSISILEKTGMTRRISDDGRQFLNRKFDEYGPKPLPPDIGLPDNIFRAF